MKSISAAIFTIAAAISVAQAAPFSYAGGSYGEHQHENLFVGFEQPDNVNSCRTYEITYTCEHHPCTVRAYRKHFNEPMWRYVINEDVYDGTYSRLAKNHPGTRYTLVISDRLNNQYTSEEVKIGSGSLSCLNNGNRDNDDGHERHNNNDNNNDHNGDGEGNDNRHCDRGSDCNNYNFGNFGRAAAGTK